MPKMKRPRILLVSPNFRPFQFSFDIFSTMGFFFPTGLACLASFVRQFGYEIKILDAYSDNLSQNDINAAIQEFIPDVIGINSPTNHEFGIATIQACKRMNPKIVTILGGLTPTLMPREIMAHVPDLDYIISGEGEIPFLYLLKALGGEMRCEDIKGLVYRREGGTVIVNEGRYRIEDLDSLPAAAKDCFLTRKSTPYFKHRSYISLETSRGCCFGCNFCVVNQHFGHGIRYRSTRLVIDELRECIEKYRLNYLWFWDSTFTADPQRTHQLLDAIIQSDIHMKFRFRCMTRLDCVDTEMLRKLKEANCYSIAYGVESCSQQVLDSYDKKWQLEKTMDVFNATRKAGIRTRALLMFNQYDAAGEAAMRRQVDELIVFLKKLKPSDSLLVPLIICPNSPMYEEILSEGGIDADGYKELFERRIISSKRISNPEIERLVTKVFSETALKNRVKLGMYNFTKFWTGRRPGCL
jgi:anaerobic magnesium-protoporphyrin IX monomethyl ester cyclase